MGKILTNWWRDSPHKRLKMFLEVQRKNYRQLSTANLRRFAAQMAPLHALAITDMHRHRIVELLNEVDEEMFKKRWEQVYGWPFDDCYDEKKFTEHVNRAKAEHEKSNTKSEPTPAPAPDEVEASCAAS